MRKSHTYKNLVNWHWLGPPNGWKFFQASVSRIWRFHAYWRFALASNFPPKSAYLGFSKILPSSYMRSVVMRRVTVREEIRVESVLFDYQPVCFLQINRSWNSSVVPITINVFRCNKTYFWMYKVRKYVDVLLKIQCFAFPIVPNSSCR